MTLLKMAIAITSCGNTLHLHANHTNQNLSKSAVEWFNEYILQRKNTPEIQSITKYLVECESHFNRLLNQNTPLTRHEIETLRNNTYDIQTLIVSRFNKESETYQEFTKYFPVPF